MSALAPTAVLTGLTMRYGALTAVSDVNLTLHPGECVALVGHNGAGKSTLIKLMLGLIRPGAGRIEVLGAPPAVGRAGVGFLPETIAFPPSLSGVELLRFYARLKGEPVACVPGLLARVGLAEAGHRRVGTWSKGMRQRLGLAQALLGTPRLLLLDEPTSGLDPELRRQFYEVVRALRDGGTTVLLSSHALTELEERADRVAVMSRGRLVLCGTMAELRAAIDLPVRILVRTDNPRGAAAAVSGTTRGEITRVNGALIELTCRHHDKMAVLRCLTGLADPVADLEILLPTLDELYASVLAQEAPR